MHANLIRLRGIIYLVIAFCLPEAYLLPTWERNLLTAFFYELGGSTWTVNQGWTINGTDPCESPGWFGVTCVTTTANESHVSAIVLPQNNLQGSLPTLIGFSFLVRLDVSNSDWKEGVATTNAVGGTLEALCDLPLLQSASFVFNRISGTIPVCLSALRSLKVLDMAYNHLDGTTPDALCSLLNLEMYRVRGNFITGTLPACLGQLRRLKKIDYSSIYADGSSPGPQSLEGSLPTTLCDIPSLEYFMFQHTQGLSGTIPSCLGGTMQPQLKWFLVQGNSLSGLLPIGLCGQHDLIYIYAYKNQLEGSIPACLGELPLLQEVVLYQNSFSGTLPVSFCTLSHLTFLQFKSNILSGSLEDLACLGNLPSLKKFELADNTLRGSLPVQLCRLSNLRTLQLYNNQLDGTIPTCFANSFPKLDALLLHDNNFAGTLPPSWSLPQLISFTASNNVLLHGSLPASLFYQQANADESDNKLRAVVIEGTKIAGTVPSSICRAAQLQTIALSGNFLSGTLPACIIKLHGLKTLQASTNYIRGTLPEALMNLSALMTLDLSYNGLSGTVPSALGYMSQQLVNVSLELNYLSCNLPSSVRHWRRALSASSKNSYFRLLKGNAFGCGGPAALTGLQLFIQDAEGLRSANSVDFDAYSCGGSRFVIPLGVVVLIVSVPVFWMPAMWSRGHLHLGWVLGLQLRVNHSMRLVENIDAALDMTLLGLGVAGGSLIMASIIVGFVFLAAESPYECQYMSAPALTNKFRANTTFSAGVGAALGVGLVLCLMNWWCPFLDSNVLDNKNRRPGMQPALTMTGAVERSSAEYANGLFCAEREAEAQTFVPMKLSNRVLTASSLLIGMIMLAVGPNAAFVATTLSDLPNSKKIFSMFGITCFKTFISTAIIPWVAHVATNVMVPSGALAFVRFRLRLVLGTAIFALSSIAAPVAIVLLTDERCLKNLFIPRGAVVTTVPVEFCQTYAADGVSCAKYSHDMVTSTFSPSLKYDGSRCVSAELSLYAPVFLGTVLLSAVFPAAIEVLVVPVVAPWCHRRGNSSRVACLLLWILTRLSSIVRPVLAKAQYEEANLQISRVQFPPFPPLPVTDFSLLARQVVERGFGQLIGTLIIALTFGLAVPAVGVACAIAALVQLAHHIHVLGIIVSVSISRDTSLPDLLGCSAAPRACAAIALATVLLLWACASMDFLDPGVTAVSVAAILAAAGLALVSAHYLGLLELAKKSVMSLAKKAAGQDEIQMSDIYPDAQAAPVTSD